MSKEENTPDTSKQVPSQNKGIKAVLEQSLQSYEKLPMLEIIFERFSRQLAVSLRNLTSEPVDITVAEFSSLRLSNYLEQAKPPYSIAVFKAIEWENFGMLTLEHNLIFTLVDLLLGGKKNAKVINNTPPEKVLTSIEQGLARQVSEIILTELGHAFDHITPSTFTFERLESNPNFVNVARPADAIIALKLKVEIDKTTKSLDLLIPYKTIEPIKEQMQQVFLGDNFGIDLEWEKMMVTSICGISLPLEAVILDKVSSIEEISRLKIGDTIIMDHPKDKDITIRSGHVELFTGKMGKVENKVAININQVIED